MDLVSQKLNRINSLVTVKVVCARPVRPPLPFLLLPNDVGMGSTKPKHKKKDTLSWGQVIFSMEKQGALLLLLGDSQGHRRDPHSFYALSLAVSFPGLGREQQFLLPPF